MSRRDVSFDQRAEQSVLGAIMHKPALFTSIPDLKAEHFYQPAHEMLFSTMQEMYSNGEEIDSITVFARLAEREELRRVGGAPYLSDLLQSFKSAENIEAYAQIVLDRWKIRRVNELGVRLLDIDADPEDVPSALDEVRSFLDGVDKSEVVSSVSFPELYESWTQWNADDRPCIETPWPAMNTFLNGGLQRQRMYVIGARPGCGKTVMGAQLALYAAQQHKSALVFSLELSKEDLAGRIIACGARIPYREITSKRLTPESYAQVSRWVSASADMSLTVDDSTDLTIEEIAHRARVHHQTHGLDVVLIDYVGLVKESKASGDSRVQRVDHIVKKARQIARDLDCAVIVLSQLNRTIEAGAMPSMSLFRESGGVEQTADVAVILARPPGDDGEEDENLPLMSAVLVKNRQGTTGVVTLRERFDEARFDA